MIGLSGIKYAWGCGGVGGVGAWYVGWDIIVGGMIGITAIFSVGVEIAVLPHDIPVIKLKPIFESQPDGSVWLLLTTTGVEMHGPVIGHGTTINPLLLPPPLLETTGGVEVFEIIFFGIGWVFCFSF